MIVTAIVLGHIIGVLIAIKLFFQVTSLDPDDEIDWFMPIVFSVFAWPIVIIVVGGIPFMRWWVKWRPFYKAKEEKAKKRRTMDWVGR